MRLNRNWFDKGERQALENRISDLGVFLPNDLKVSKNTCLDIDWVCRRRYYLFLRMI